MLVKNIREAKPKKKIWANSKVSIYVLQDVKLEGGICFHALPHKFLHFATKCVGANLGSTSIYVIVVFDLLGLMY